MNKIHVTTPQPLRNAMRQQVEQWLTDNYGDHTTVWHVDESLLAGIVIFDGTRVFDGSAKSKLNQLL